MNLQYDTEQIILRDTAESFLRTAYDFKIHRRIVASDSGWSREIWDQFAKLGWLGLPFAPEDGGSGGSAVETAILMEAFGRFLIVEPYVPTVLLAGGVISALGSAAERKALLAPVAEGRARLALALDDKAEATLARRTTRGFVVSGAKAFVLGAPMADTLLVSARIGPGQDTGVFVVPAGARGIAVRRFLSADGRRAADVELVEVDLPANALLGGQEKAGAAIDEVVERAIAALSADAVGAIGAMVRATIEYTKTRVQFGQPLAKFQALQNRMVRMKVEEEEARASALFATLALDGPPDRRTRAVSGAKAKIGRCARFVHQNAIQLHGAIGTTSELPLGAYAKRLLAYEALLGSTRAHLRRYGSLISKPELAEQGLLAAS